MEIIILKFFIVFVLSFLFGIERQISKKPVGFGTFIFVSIGSCALGIIALDIQSENPLPLLGAIVTGIGFLGAGALIKSTDKIFGFTSAAGIWIFAIIGLIIGIGEYMVGIMTYFFTWVVILADKYFERKGIGAYNRKITIHTKGVIQKSEILPLFEGMKWKLSNLIVDKQNKTSTIEYIVSLPRENVSRLSQKLNSKNWVTSFSIE
ncbi:MAG: MgtC/SapB family protein [Nanoarchaeota archaeon]